MIGDTRLTRPIANFSHSTWTRGAGGLLWDDDSREWYDPNRRYS